jgi:hypothetical protein
MSATVIRTDPWTSELQQLGLRLRSLGQLRYCLSASGERTRDVYSGDGALRAAIDGCGDQEVQGRCCVTICGGQALGVLPADGIGPLVCFAVPTSCLTVQTEGNQGLLRKRPTLVRLQTDGFDLTLSDVDKLLLNLEKYQAGQENALVTALRQQP